MSQIWGWSAVAIASLCHGYYIFLHATEPLLWIPVGAFLSAFAINLLENRRQRGLSILAVLFVSQALLTASLGYIIVLLAFADTLLGAELFLSSKITEKNQAVQSLYQSALSLLPATVGLLLRLEGDSLAACVAVSVCLRLFSWPVRHWLVEISGKNQMFPTYVGIASSFALWHILAFPKPDVWAVIALAAAIVFSLGSKYMEIYAALTLGLYAVNPVWGVVGAALWPLLGHKGLSTYIVALLTAGAGLVLASGSTKVFVPEAAMVFTAFAGLACARVFSAVENLSVRWYLISLDSALSILWATLTIVFLSPPLPVWEPAGLVFGIVFVLAFGVGKFLNTRRPRFFRALAGLSPEIFSREIFSAEFMSEKRGETVSLTQTRARVWLFEMIESQTYLALLLGLLGLFLLKGLR